MGLGKTVSVISGILLRESFDSGPALVIGPSWSVCRQWVEHARRSGFAEAEILEYKGADRQPKLRAVLGAKHRVVRLVIADRYALLHDMMQALPQVRSWEANEAPALVPRMSAAVAGRLGSLYDYFNQKQRINAHGTLQPPTKPDLGADNEVQAALKAVRKEARRLQRANILHNTWSIVALDEAHFLKNPLSWWGIHGVMLGLHARRFVAVTGTPYTTRNQDLATLCAMINPIASCAEAAWWDRMVPT